MKAIEDLKNYLKNLKPTDKSELWDYLDGNPEAIHELIDCVIVQDGDL